ncbi:MAG TPA: hypothetical protein VMW58_14435 [Anaerolineae bacterium]|nr:hypothetical protein [Anaerolineae bacterium]
MRRTYRITLDGTVDGKALVTGLTNNERHRAMNALRAAGYDRARAWLE